MVPMCGGFRLLLQATGGTFLGIFISFNLFFNSIQLYGSSCLSWRQVAQFWGILISFKSQVEVSEIGQGGIAEIFNTGDIRFQCYDKFLQWIDSFKMCSASIKRRFFKYYAIDILYYKIQIRSIFRRNYISHEKHEWMQVHELILQIPLSSL